MNKLKRAARAYKMGNLYGTNNGLQLADNRNFRTRNSLGDLVGGFINRMHFQWKLDDTKQANRETHVEILHQARMGPGIQGDLGLRNEVEMAGHLWDLSNGQLQALAKKVLSHLKGDKPKQDARRSLPSTAYLRARMLHYGR